jgi:hypothetical protein
MGEAVAREIFSSRGKPHSLPWGVGVAAVLGVATTAGASGASTAGGGVYGGKMPRMPW